MRWAQRERGRGERERERRDRKIFVGIRKERGVVEARATEIRCR